MKVLKDSLSEYLRRVGEGERIVITDRGRPVALLAPYEQEAASRAAWELVAAGGASWGGGKPRGAENPPQLEGKRAAEIVLEDRR
ncbi:MAG TPA: type II toxin-antitoxin system prevent-host-death family antitoxin [Thermoanaerobaculia bacterium]|nr:type II toxin-antitoxin system prevent-host-death family antitoxin [Thermoanaerobaculia bacterium]